MGLIKVDIERIVTNIGKSVTFMQPIFETITNSLESHSSKIILDLFEDETIDGQNPGLISGFSVADNGDGFNKTNIDGFCTLWNDNKIELGCKGSGRFTWLSVYNKIQIHSEIVDIKEIIDFVFNKNFTQESISKTKNATISANKTTITFTELRDKYRKHSKDGQLFADVEYIKILILNYLSIKLFMLKKNGIAFEIIIKNKKNRCSITWEDIPNLEKKNYLISGIDDIKYQFEMYYNFVENGKNSKKMYFCANDRCIKENDDDDLNFSCSLPNDASLQMMVCSSYLNERNGDNRSTFEVLDSLKSANLLNPITFSQIKKESLMIMNEIIIERYPEMIERNKQEVEKAIIEVPFLAKYIKENDDVVKSSKVMIKNAVSQHEKEKNAVRANFAYVLSNRNINPEQFNRAVSQMSDIAAIELGEYILYRDNVIEGLRKGINEKNTKEDFVHNIIIPKNTSSNSDQISDRKFNNIWLFDDRFMTFSYCASDKTIKQIVEAFYPNADEIFRDRKRPDLFFAFDKEDSLSKRNAVMIELKGPNANEDEKAKSLNELPVHIKIIRKNIPSIETIYGYIITSIDENFKETIEAHDYQPLFSKDSQGRAYYGYFENVNAHIYIIDFDVVLDDAKLRNKTFIDLIKQN